MRSLDRGIRIERAADGFLRIAGERERERERSLIGRSIWMTSIVFCRLYLFNSKTIVSRTCFLY